MNRKLSTVIYIQAFIIIMLFWVLVFYGRDEYKAYTQRVSDDEIESPSLVSSMNGTAMIEVNLATQLQSAILTSPLIATVYSENILSFGNVLSIAELVILRASYHSARAEAMIIQNALTASQKNYDRLYALNQDDKNVSDQVVIIAKNDVSANQTKLSAIESNARNLADSMRQQWGNVLTDLAIQPNQADLFKQLVENKMALIQITLPFSAHTPANGSHVSIAPTAALDKTVEAHYLSPAPNTNLAMQGKTFFYYAKAEFLRAGLTIKVLDFNANNSAPEGVMIPNNAVVWYAGRPWVYQKISETAFMRLPINNDHEIEDGWFYQGALKANDLVVTSGAQLLLSEEFKYQITNENDD
jgi:hypothetical protein